MLKHSRSKNLAVFLILIGLAAIFFASDSVRADALAPTPKADRDRPAMRDFLGLNVHTVSFKPEIYASVCRRLRDYHPFDWDTGKDTSQATKFPMADNGVPWDQLYGKWTAAGYDIDACIQFDNLPPGDWKDAARDARAYGESFAKFFGPSGEHHWVSSVEIGNEPAKYTEPQYRDIFQAMARGLHGDAKMKVATCAVMTGKPDQWSKPMSAVDGLGNLFDVVNVHAYAFKEHWPTWRRSYPEDASIPFLKDINDVIQYRNAHLAGKQIWLTEFGYDSSTKSPDPKGEWAKWVGLNDEQQAQYIVRSFLVLSALDIDRAYLYFFNDKDEPQLHGASGITRNYKPKPSFYAMAHLYETLGDYHFVRAVAKKDGDLYCYEYARPAPSKDRIFVAWTPTGEAKTDRKVIPLGAAGARVYRAERMPVTADAPEKVASQPLVGGVGIEVGATPVFIWTK